MPFLRARGSSERASERDTVHKKEEGCQCSLSHTLVPSSFLLVCELNYALSLCEAYQAEGPFTQSLDCLNPERNVVGAASRLHEPGGLGH